MVETRTDRRVREYAEWIVRRRWAVLTVSVLALLAAASGGRFLSFTTNYRVFFSEDNPQLVAFESLQNIYTKSDNILFVITPDDGNIFTRQTLAVVEEVTEAAWQLPYATRVDSISNFQHTRAEGDDLIVADLVENSETLSPYELGYIKETALAEPLLARRLISSDGRVTGVNVTFTLADNGTEQVPEAAAAARQLAAAIEAAHADVDVRLSGIIMLNNAFAEASKGDLAKLVPLMYLGIFIVMLFLLRSVSATFGTMLVIAASAMTAMGLAGYAGVALTGPSATAPTVIMTLAVADSVHILVSMLSLMRRGTAKMVALVESVRINFQPVLLTSLTTAVGFLSLNFSDAPPFRDLGNITAVGVMAAFVFSVVMLPAFIAILPVRVKVRSNGHSTLMERFGDFVVTRRKPLLWGTSLIVVALLAMIPRNELNDEFVKYFDSSVEFRRDTDYATRHLTGTYQVQFNIAAGESSAISEPDYLATIEAFADWYRAQPGVIHVRTIAETMQRLNKNLHGDDPGWYRLPEERDLAAQYLLLYEMSLPFGLDLNNEINVDKSATRVTVTLDDLSTVELRAIAEDGEQWLRDNAPPVMHATGVSPAVMFAHISERNINSMIVGTSVALVLISLILVVALRSVKFGVLSLIPNLIPAGLAFGVWALVDGQVNMAISVVTGMTLGVVVDDTVHFLSKYLRARREKGLDAAGAVRYAFATVGQALVVTSLILVAGFAILSQSAFGLNSEMGVLTAIAIAAALFADFLLFAPLLVRIEDSDTRVTGTVPVAEAAEALA